MKKEKLLYTKSLQLKIFFLYLFYVKREERREKI